MTYIVMTSSSQSPAAKKWPGYRNIALVELEPGFVGRPKMISERAKGIKNILRYVHSVYVGSTPQSEGRRLLDAWQAEACKLNRRAAIIRPLPDIDHVYEGSRRLWNNGFRRCWLANGVRHAAAINAAQRGEIDSVLHHADNLGGLTQRRSWAKSALRLASKNADDTPDYTIANGCVYIPRLSWTFSNMRQIAVIEHIPLFSVERAHKRSLP